MRGTILIESGVLLPLFPLHAVLFPGSQLSLHIFEDRYREMVKMCLDSNCPFVVSLIAEGLEVGVPVTAYAIGTAAQIEKYARMPDGRYHIICSGVQRVRVGTPVGGALYARAQVEAVPNGLEDETIEVLTGQVCNRFATLASAMRLESPVFRNNPTDLSFGIAAKLPIDMSEKQSLLEMSSTARRLEALLAIFDREMRLYSSVGKTRAVIPTELQEMSSN